MKKQLFKISFLFIAAFFIPLIVFFVYASRESSLYIFLSAGLLVIIFFLFSLRSYLAKKQSENQSEIQNIEEQINLLESEIQCEQLAIHALRTKIVNFGRLKTLTEKLGRCLYLEDTSKILSEEIDRLFGGKEETVILYLFHSKDGELGISSSRRGQVKVNVKLKKGDVFDEWVLKTMQPLLIEDIKKDYRFDVDNIQRQDLRVIHSLISIPLRVAGKILGILRIDSPVCGRFVTEDLRFLTTIGGLGAIAIENAQLYERVRQLAIRDGLTGLYLRSYLIERMSEEFSRQLRHKNYLSLLMIDLDKFKKYNDNFGHTAGDIVLRAVSMILVDFFKAPGNLVCRYGGEEFVILLPGCPKEKGVELAGKIRKKIGEQEIFLRRRKNHITVSIGVATFPVDARGKDELIQKADMAMYQAKEKGRNMVCAA